MTMRKHQEIKATVYCRKGHVLATATNSYTKSHPIQKKHAMAVGLPFKEYLHAEVAAIIKAQKFGKPYRIKIERYSSDGTPMLAMPCPICQLAIKEAGIHFVEYTC